MQLVRFVQLEKFFCIKLSVFALGVELVGVAGITDRRRRRRRRGHGATARAMGVGKRAYLLQVIVQDDELFALEAEFGVLFEEFVTFSRKRNEQLRDGFGQ